MWYNAYINLNGGLCMTVFKTRFSSCEDNKVFSVMVEDSGRIHYCGDSAGEVLSSKSG